MHYFHVSSVLLLSCLYFFMIVPFSLIGVEIYYLALITLVICAIFAKYNGSKTFYLVSIFCALFSIFLIILNISLLFAIDLAADYWMLKVDFIVGVLTFIFISLNRDNSHLSCFINFVLAFFIFSSLLFFIFAVILMMGPYSIWNSSYRIGLEESIIFLLLSSFVIFNELKKFQLIKIVHIVISSLLLILGQLFDLLSPLGIAGGVAYMPLVLSSLWYRGANFPFAFAIISSILTILGFFISIDEGVGYDKVITNRILAIVAIWVTAIVINIQRKTYERVKDGEENFALAFNSSAIGIALVSPQGKWLKVNDAISEIVGYSKEELLKIDFQTITYKDDLDLDLRYVKQMLDGTIKTYRMEKRYYHKQGHVVWILLSVALVRNKDGSPRYFISQIQDINDRKEKERLLKLERDRANNANEIKSMFLATMSHEIRTPLNSIIGFSDLLKRMKLKKEVKEYVDSIYSSGDLLLTLINDILDFSKIEAGELKIENSEVNLIEILSNVVEMMSDLARKNDVDMNLYVDSKISNLIYSDEVRIKQILINLLSNAIKFSKSGQTLLNVLIAQDYDNKFRLRFEVIDNGIGIAKERQDDIFDSFFQVDSSTTRQYGGSGLGLSIFKRLVELMGGVIGLESELTKGSKFWFEIDCFKGQDNSFDKIEIAQISSKKSLIIGNDNFAIKALRNYFNDLSYEIDQVELDNFDSSKAKYDLIIFIRDKGNDIVNINEQYPDLLNANSKIAIISNANIGSKDLKKLGYDICLKKPLAFDKLYQDLAELFVEKESKTLAEKKSNSEIKSKILIAEDDELSYNLLKDIVEDIGYEVDVAYDGQQAFDKLEKDYCLYKMVFMDCRMPVMNGFDATREIRNQIWGKDITIVATTANALQGDREKCLRFGMNDYLTKPVRYDDVKSVIEKYLL